MSRSQTHLSPGQIIPDISLPSTLGRPLHLGAFRHRNNLVVVFTGEYFYGLKDWLQNMSDNIDDFVANETEVFAIVPRPLQDIERKDWLGNLTFPILADTEASIHKQFSVDRFTPTTVITDRFGEIFSIDRGRVDPVEILRSVNYIELLCPE